MYDKSFHIRIPKRWVRIAMIVTTTALIVAPLTAIASHNFADVPDSNTFHSDIEWMAAAGVTKGCNPPANTLFCPKDEVTRETLSAFMHRLAVNRVVDAGKLDGKAPSYYQGSVAGSLISSLTPASAVRTRVSQVAGFNVPQGGGALVASADMSMVAAAPGDTVIVWLEIDGNGACGIATIPQTGVLHQFVAEQFGAFSTSTTAAANAGVHQVDLCAFTTGGVTFGTGALTVQWVETTQIGTTATASTGVTPESKLAEMSSSSFGE